MSLIRFNPKRDANEAKIVDALRMAGCLVECISGNGVPDLLVWSPFLQRVVLMEVKQEKAMKSRKKLKPAFERWREAGAPVHIVESISDAVYAVGAA